MPLTERLTPAKVVQVAGNLADELGDLQQLTLAQVAAHLNVKLPSLYNHVNGLDGLRREIAIEASKELIEHIQAAAFGRAGDEAITAIAYAYRNFAKAHPGRYSATLAAPKPDDHEHIQVADKLLALLFRVLEYYQLGETDSVHVVRGLRSILHGFVALEMLGGFKMAIGLDESFERLFGQFLAGLRPQSHQAQM